MKKNQGITLIALVITIIVLLILAGISIMMLTGNNSILNQATNARKNTIEGQEKEAITLAYNGVLANTQGAGVTAEDLQRELQANGNDATAVQQGNKIVVTFASGNVYTVDSNGNIQLKNGNNSEKELKLSVREIETESRAVVLEATVGELPTEDDLKELSPEELQEMFVAGYSNLTGESITWDMVKEELGEDATVNSVFISSGLSSFGYSNEYDFIIKTWALENAIFTCNGETITGTKAEFGITKNGEYTVTVSNENGEKGSKTVNVTKCKIETYSEIQDDNTHNNYVMVTSKDNKQVPVPKGFAYGTSNNVGTVSSGFVITDSVDSDGYSTGNEFVWIPVNSDLTVSGTTKKMAKESTGDYEGTTGGLTNYEGVLYDFSGTGENSKSEEMSSYGQSTASFREPAYLTDYRNGDGLSYNTVGIAQDRLQTEYNAMIESVKVNGGFYVARYEMGIENGKAISKLNVNPVPSYDEKTDMMWYGLYSKAKTYANSKNSVTSSMIWGSQYDAMLNFALNGTDKEKVTATGNGNHSYSIVKTGLTKTSDSINNIYDLEGNLNEWSFEAYGTDSRIYRGGNYLYSYSPSDRDCYYPNDSFNFLGSRISLYVK